MNDRGILFAQQTGIGATDDGNWVGMKISDQESEFLTMLPPLNIPDIVSALLVEAQKSVKKIPPAQVIEGVTKNVQNALFCPVDAAGVMLAADGDLLLVNVGCGALCFRLSDAAKRELQALGRAS